MKIALKIFFLASLLSFSSFVIAQDWEENKNDLDNVDSEVGIETDMPEPQSNFVGSSKISQSISSTGTQLKQCHSASISTAGWYRVATNGPVNSSSRGGSRAHALFTVWDTDGGQHSAISFYASVHYGKRPSIILLSRSRYGGGHTDKIRVIEGGTYNGAAVEIFVGNSSLPGNIYYCIEQNFQSHGWTANDWITGSLPSGFLATQLDLDQYDPVMAYAGDGIANSYVLNRNGGIQLKGSRDNQLRLQTADNNAVYQSWYDSSNQRQGYLGFVASLSKFKIITEKRQDIIIDGGNVGIGTSEPQSTLAVNGKITATEVEVTATGWPDYVFQDEHKLKSLPETESYIKENKHLPGLPSEKEVLSKGINLGEMQAKLLTKIEELTLHLIEQNKQLSELKQKNQTILTQNQILAIEIRQLKMLFLKGGEVTPQQ